MKKFSLKNRIWAGALIGSCIFGIASSHQLRAAIPAGTLNEHEYTQISNLVREVQTYTNAIKNATDDLFIGRSSFGQNLTTMKKLRDSICTIHANITKGGSPSAQAILGNLKGLTQHLMEAQKKWVTTLETKNIITMGNNRSFMAARYDDALRFLLGGKIANRHNGEGLIGCLEKAHYSELKNEAQSILKNVHFIFNYAKEKRIKEIHLALHLIKYKGFTPTQVRYIAWLLQ